MSFIALSCVLLLRFLFPVLFRYSADTCGVRLMRGGESRFEIANDDAPGWEDAERLIREGRSGRGVVSVRSEGKGIGKGERKRKAGEMTAREVYEKEVLGGGDGDGGKNGKDGKKGKKKR